MDPRHDPGNENNGQWPADDWARRQIRHAARLAPAELAERLEEEWLADLDAHTSPLARIRFALGCYRATLTLSRDPIAYGASVVSAAAPAAAIATVHAPLRGSPSGRTIALFVIAGLHVLMILAFSGGLAMRFVKPIEYTPTGRFIEPPHPEKTLPPDIGTLPGDLDRPLPPVNAPVPEVGPITFPEDLPITVHASGDATPAEPARVVRLAGGPGKGFPSTADFYPALSRTLGEAGAATVDVCVDTRGRLTNDPRLRESSGYARLDAGALALARAGTGHYRSATENGQPVASCYPFRVRFALTR